MGRKGSGKWRYFHPIILDENDKETNISHDSYEQMQKGYENNPRHLYDPVGGSSRPTDIKRFKKLKVALKCELKKLKVDENDQEQDCNAIVSVSLFISL